MKRILILLLILAILNGCSHSTKENSNVYQSPAEKENFKGVWIYYNEISMISEGGGTEESFRQKVNKIFSDCKNFGLNALIVQVRPFADSFYPSSVFPWSKYLTGEIGKSVPYDPLKIMIEVAHENNLKFHAWINPFRISYESEYELNEMINNYDDVICKLENGTYFNPSSQASHKLILEGVREIVKNYNVDGIHIDDYFYPSTSENIDKKEFDLYCKYGGRLSLEEWRIAKINSFVSNLYNSVKYINNNVLVSVSPAGNIENNYNSLYADVSLWSSEKGYCDMIIPQLYFGFNNKKLPFSDAVVDWSNLNSDADIELVAGLAAYKSAAQETEEWSDFNILNKQVDFILSNEKYDGYCLFSYSSLISIKNRNKQPSDIVNKN